MSIDITVGAEAIYKAMSEVEVEPDEIFLLETKRTTSEPKFIRVEIHDFAKKMKDEKFKKEAILTPTFDIVGKKLAISVQPEEKNSEGIAVYLMNQNKEEITASCTIDGVVTQRSFEKKELSAGSGLGFSCFVTHEDFKKWAVRHDDLKLDVRVTLHFSDNVSGWTIKGYLRKIIFSRIIYNFNPTANQRLSSILWRWQWLISTSEMTRPSPTSP